MLLNILRGLIPAVYLALAIVLHAGTANAAEAGLKPGDRAPLFTLSDTAGGRHDLAGYLKQGKTVVLEWFNPDCPFVRKYHEGAQPNPSLREAYAYAASKGAVWLAINSGAQGKQGYGQERNAQARRDYGMSYPVLLDASGKTGRAYGAASTPTVYIVSPKGVVVYIGGVDDTQTNQDKPGERYLLKALKQYFNGQKVEPSLTPHPGCGVKYAD